MTNPIVSQVAEPLTLWIEGPALLTGSDKTFRVTAACPQIQACP